MGNDFILLVAGEVFGFVFVSYVPPLICYQIPPEVDWSHDSELVVSYRSSSTKIKLLNNGHRESTIMEVASVALGK